MTSPRFAILDVSGLKPHALDACMSMLGITSFESMERVVERQRRMERTLRRYDAFANAWIPPRCLSKAGCELHHDCNAACYVATRLYRAEMVLSEPPVFLENDLPVELFTVVPSCWQVDVGQLQSFDFGRAKRLVGRALRGAGNGSALLAAFGIEVTLCEEGGREYWAPHVHGIAAGVPRQVLSRALRKLAVDDQNLRPVHARRVPMEEVPAVFNYICKRVDTRKVRYFTESGRPRWRNGLPLRSHQQAEIDAWKSAFPIGCFYGRLGFKRNGRFLVLT